MIASVFANYSAIRKIFFIAGGDIGVVHNGRLNGTQKIV